MKKFLAILLVVVMALGVVGCSGSASNNSAAKDDPNAPIVIGFMGWSSGPDAMWGLVPQYVLEYQVKKLNAEGGILGRQIDLRTYDISGLDGDFSEAVNVANKLIQSGVDIIMGPSNSTQGTAVAQLCNDAGVIHLPVGEAQSVTVDANGKVFPWTFRPAAILQDSISAEAKYTYEQLGAPKVAILYETTQIDCVDMYNIFNDSYTAIGGEITGVATYTINDIEFRAQIASLAQGNPDYIYMPAMGYKEVGFLCLQLKELGYENIKVLTTNAVDTVNFMDQVGNVGDGLIFLNEVDTDDAKYAEFNAEYDENYSYTGMAMNICGYYAMNQLQLAKYAIEQAGGTDKEKMREALENITDMDLFTSHITGFAKDTHNMQGIEFVVKEYKDAKFVTAGKIAAE